MQSVFTTEARASGSMELPPPASTRTHPTPSSSIGDFLGNARESRHDRRLSVSSFDGDAPPSYQDVEALPLPSYSERGHKEPVTLAMYLFRFGFLFPPFWILGACILMSDLHTPEAPSFDEPEHLAWLPDKTQAERDAIVQEMRRVLVTTKSSWTYVSKCLMWSVTALFVCLSLQQQHVVSVSNACWRSRDLAPTT